MMYVCPTCVFYQTVMCSWRVKRLYLRDILWCITYHIQGDSGGICNTLGNDSMCDSKQKISYEHWSEFERLPRYVKKKIHIPRLNLLGFLFMGMAEWGGVPHQSGYTCWPFSSQQQCLCPYRGPSSWATACNTQYPATRSQMHWGWRHLWKFVWDVPDVEEPGFCPLQIISNTMVSTCMHVMLVVMLFIM